MSERLQALLDKVLALPEGERVELLGHVVESLDSPEDIKAAWTVEIRRRIAEYDAGKTKGVPWRQALARIDAKLARHGRRARQ